MQPTPRRPSFAPVLRVLAGLAAGLSSLLAAEGNEPLVPVSVALANPSGPRGATQFTRLPPEQTGLVVDNAYADPEMWGKRYKEFISGAMGTGIAVGDYDSDGKPDLFVSTKTFAGRLFKNLGGWKFQDVTVQANVTEVPGSGNAGADDGAGAWRQGAVFADVNNDGRLDLYVCRNGYPNLLYMNQGDGTFREEAAKRGLALVDASGVGAFCDYDRDGWLDVYVQTNFLDATARPSGQRDRLYRNNGDGAFADVTDAAGIRGDTLGHSLLWLDVDNDGWQDLYVANDFDAPDQLYRNNHDGTFTDVVNKVFPHLSFSSMGSDVGDVNNDGFLDLFVADMAPTSREKDRRGMAAARTKVLQQLETPGVALQFMQNMLFLNTGRGVFQEAAPWAGIAASDWTWSVRLEDFDNDGWLDLFVTNGMAREANNGDILKRMMQSESDNERIMAMKNSPVFAETHLAFRNDRGQGFKNANADWGLGETGVSFGSATGDFDGDGDLDLVYINYQGGLSVFRNDSEENQRVVFELKGTRSNRFGVGGLVHLKNAGGTQVRPLVVTRGYLSGSELIAQFGLGADTAIDEVRVDWPSGGSEVFKGLRAGRRYTLVEGAGVVVSAAPAALEGWFKQEDLSLGTREAPALAPEKNQSFLPFRLDRAGAGMAVGDVDGDGEEDVYVTGDAGSSSTLLRRREGKIFAQATPWKNASKMEEGPALFLDANGDGKQDLLVTQSGTRAAANSTEYQPELYLGDGVGNFVFSPLLPTLSISAGAVVSADVFRSGAPTVFIGGRVLPGFYPRAPRSALLTWKEGRFVDVTSVAPGLENVGLVKSALFTDVDGDGWIDLLVSLEWGYVTYFHNQAGQGFENWTERAGFAKAGKGWWNGLAAADFNGDGRLDYAVGNLGLNTAYQPDASKPARLYYGNFSGTGARTLVEGVWDNGRYFPTRTKMDLGSRLPAVGRKYPRDDLYARASLADLFGEKALADAELYEATEMGNGVFLSQADGTFHFERFPREAQLAPFQGLVAGDLDGDGKADLCAVQNAFIAMPRFDGGVGVFLKGDGAGHFEVVPPALSGLVITGDAKALVALPSPAAGSPRELLLTRNQGPAQRLRVLKGTGASRVRIRRSTTGGGLFAPGTRIVAEFTDGSRQMVEVYAGGGWWSQGTASVEFACKAGATLKKVTVRGPDGAVSEAEGATGLVP